jgi:arylformamidase
VIYDLSPVIGPSLAVWPGDTPPSREILLDMRRGDHLTLSTLKSTVHVGAHADAPSHFSRDGESIEKRPLDLYLGPCRLVRIRAVRGAALQPADLAGVLVPRAAGSLPPPGDAHATDEVTRLLIDTGSFPDPRSFNEDFAALSPALVDDLHARGVRLVGLDSPSVDLFASKDLSSHQALLRHDMAILEGLVLAHVPEGVYELIALPLPLAGADGSPVRAVLRDLT